MAKSNEVFDGKIAKTPFDHGGDPVVPGTGLEYYRFTFIRNSGHPIDCEMKRTPLRKIKGNVNSNCDAVVHGYFAKETGQLIVTEIEDKSHHTTIKLVLDWGQLISSFFAIQFVIPLVIIALLMLFMWFLIGSAIWSLFLG